MDWLLFSVYSPGSFFDSIVCILIATFLIFKKEKVSSTYWLLGFFLGEFALFFAYAASYSIAVEFGAYHRYFSCLVMFGNASLVGFAYNYPKNDKPKEAKIVISISFLLALIAYIHFILNTSSMEKIYSFKAHIYTFDFGKEVGLVILLLYIIPVLILARKAIQYSEYNGYFSKWLNKPEDKSKYFMYYLSKFIVGWIKFFIPKGKDAESARGFGIPIFLHILVAVLNVLVKSDKISYDLYASLFAYSTMFIAYYLVITYINNSPEPTSFMIKLVGISLGSILVVLGYAGEIAISGSEQNYDEKRIMEVGYLKSNISSLNFDNISPNVEYIILKPATEKRYDGYYTILYQKENNFRLQDVMNGEDKEKKLIIKEIKSKIKQKNILEDEKDKISTKELSKISQIEMKRLYRNTIQNRYTHFDFIENNIRYEVGFSYMEYRKAIHHASNKIIISMIGTTLLVLVFFPLLFSTSLIKPLNKLLNGVKKVNAGNLDVEVPIQTQDEIGFLSGSFNSMVKSIRQAKQDLQEYANNLEEKVEERTKELQLTLTQVEKLKTQQDGDYFLTTLLLKPLSVNKVLDSNLKIDFFIKQKKEFNFKKSIHEIGGDICITLQLKLKGRNYITFINADAMGKSMQGAGGILVLGAVFQSIVHRTKASAALSEVPPEQWIKSAFKEMHYIFESFNGSMLVSLIFGLIEESSGLVYYINAEHPWMILYRDGKANFIEQGLDFRKLGTSGVEGEIFISTYQLLPGDLMIMGSDGKDDLILSQDFEKLTRVINEDERLFLQKVEQANGDLNSIFTLIHDQYELLDDFSLLSIQFPDREIESRMEEQNLIESTLNQAKIYIGKKDFQSAVSILKKSYTENKNRIELALYLIKCYMKLRMYKESSIICKEILSKNELDSDLLFKLSYCLKMNHEFEEAIELAERVKLREPKNIRNLIHLTDMYLATKNMKRATKLLNKILSKEPENKTALKMKDFIIV